MEITIILVSISDIPILIVLLALNISSCTGLHPCTYSPFMQNQVASKPTGLLIASNECSLLERKPSQKISGLIHTGDWDISTPIIEIIAAPPALMVIAEITTRYCRIRSPGVYRGSTWPQR